MKRYITLSLLGLMAVTGSLAQEAFTLDGFTYVPSSAATACVTGCTLEEGALAVIPEKAGDYTITAIAPQAFSGSPVAAVYMPATVTSIGDRAFAECQATFIKLSPNATAIGSEAFLGCSAMGHIDLPEELQRLQNGTLNGTSIYTYGNTQLPRLDYVGDYALAGTRIQHFPLTDAVNHLGKGAFSGCTSLQDIHLPSDLTEIPDYLLAGTGIRQLALPSNVRRIGISAFEGTPLAQIDLSAYLGSIDMLAFNGCQALERITLPADNPYCFTSADGKVVYDRQRQDLVTILPTVDRLTVSYPATGQRIDSLLLDETDGVAYYQKTFLRPLSGTFHNLQQLELPYTWQASLDDVNGMENLKELTMRMPASRIAEVKPLTGLQPPYHDSYNPERDVEGCQVYVFSYAKDALITSNRYAQSWAYLLGQERNPETREYEYSNLHVIERPTEELYMAEVLPMYDNMRLVEENQAILWDADWNAAIEEAYPQYFTAGDALSTRIDYKKEFRNYMASQYMTPEHYKAFLGEGANVIQCIDGRLRFADGFDANNFTNWFLHTNFIPATGYVPVTNPMSAEYTSSTYSTPVYTQCQTYAADAAWNIPVSEYALFSIERGTSNVTYALHMVPGVAYNIYAIVPPSHPLSNDETQYKNRIRPRLNTLSAIYEETGVAKLSNRNGDNIDILYESAKVDSLLLFENVEVISDLYNLLTIEGRIPTSSMQREGYINRVPLIGILCVPQSELEVYPDAVQGIRQENTTVVARYDISGRRLSSPQRGINIIVMSDGTTRKVMVK